MGKKRGLISRGFRSYLKVSTVTAEHDYMKQRIDSMGSIYNATKDEINKASGQAEDLVRDKEEYRKRYGNARLAAFAALIGIIVSVTSLLNSSALMVFLACLASFSVMLIVYFKMVRLLFKARLSYSHFEDVKYREKLSVTTTDFLNRAGNKPSILFPISINSKEERI